jgi:hypothetical protein
MAKKCYILTAIRENVDGCFVDGLRVYGEQFPDIGNTLTAQFD